MGASVGQTLQILLKYVCYDDNSEIIELKMLTRDCYDEWLDRKPRKPAYPEEAFRKIITGHCQARDGLDPFPPKVEASVLEVIRQKEIWPCFRNTQVRIGMRGFTKQGYWEVLTQQQCQQNSALVMSRSLDGLFTFEINEEKDDFMNSLSMSFAEDFCSLMFQLYSEIVSGKNEELNRRRMFLEKSIKALPCRLGRQFVISYLKRQIETLIINPRQKVMTVNWSANAYYFVSPEFQQMKEHERKFFQDRPVATLVDEPSSCSPVDMDNICRAIYRGDIIGTYSLEHFVFKQTYYLCQDSVMTTLLSQKQVWYRTFEKRLNGTPFVAINRYFLKDNHPGVVFVEMQDVSDKFRDYIETQEY